jgi:hypothetical protein
MLAAHIGTPDAFFLHMRKLPFDGVRVPIATLIEHATGARSESVRVGADELERFATAGGQRDILDRPDLAMGSSLPW